MSCDLLVGSTGFVGGNLLAKHTFAAECHSSDITAQYGTRPDLCVYAGVPAAMFLANADPEADLAVMRAARENIRQIAPKRLILISSIAVLAQGEHLQSFIDDMQYVSHVHISEPGLVPIERRPEHKELALLLGAVGYRGFVSVEMAHTDVDTIRRTMDYIAEVFA